MEITIYTSNLWAQKIELSCNKLDFGFDLYLPLIFLCHLITYITGRFPLNPLPSWWSLQVGGRGVGGRKKNCPRIIPTEILIINI